MSLPGAALRAFSVYAKHPGIVIDGGLIDLKALPGRVSARTKV